MPNKKAGSYVNCPLCHGRLWVPKDAQADAAHLDEVVAQAQPNPPASPPPAATADLSAKELPPAASAATLAKVLTPPGATSPVNPTAVASGNSPGVTAAGSPAGGPAATGNFSGNAAGGSPSGNTFAASGAVAPPTVGYSQPPLPSTAAPFPGYAPVPPTGYGQSAPAAPPVVGSGGVNPRAGASSPGTWAPSGAHTIGGAPPAAIAAPEPPPIVAPSAAVAQAQQLKAPRFISADAALSRLQLASDGRLPQLHLHEAAEEPKEKQTTRSVNPVLLFVLLGASVLASILMVLVDSGGGSAGQARSVEEAWRIIEAEYFGDPDRPQRPQRYQELLRDAQRARNRGDIETQNKLLREVLTMLDAEPHPNDRGRGLTGSPGRDKRLRQQIIVLLREK